MTEDITVKKYFEETVPEVFGGLFAGAPIKGMEGTEFTLQFNVTGEGGGLYGITAKNGKDISVTPGRLSAPLIEVEVAERDWRDTVTGKVEGVMDMFMRPEMASRKYFDVLKETKGMLVLALTKPDGGLFQSKITFNGAGAPSTTIKMKVSDYAAMNRGEINGPSAFMAGKMKIEGDMGFAMKLGRFMGA